MYFAPDERSAAAVDYLVASIAGGRRAGDRPPRGRAERTALDGKLRGLSQTESDPNNTATENKKKPPQNEVDHSLREDLPTCITHDLFNLSTRFTPCNTNIGLIN